MDCFWRPLVEALYLGSCGCLWSTGLCGNDARDTSTGDVLWEYDIRQDGALTSFHGNPLLSDDLIFIAADNTFMLFGDGQQVMLDVIAAMKEL